MFDKTLNDKIKKAFLKTQKGFFIDEMLLCFFKAFFNNIYGFW